MAGYAFRQLTDGFLGGGGFSFAMPFASANIAGNVILVYRFGQGTTQAPTDSLGNTFIQVGTSGSGSIGNYDVWRVASCKAGANTVTCHYGVGGNNTGFAVEISAPVGALGFDTSAQNQTAVSTNSAIETVGPLTTAVSGEYLAYGAMIVNAGITPDTITNFSPFTLQSRGNINSNSCVFFDNTVGAPGSYSATLTTNVGRFWANSLIAFKNPPTNRNLLMMMGAGT